MEILLNLVSFGVLVIGMIDDLRSRKIHNKLILILLPISLITALVVYGWQMGFLTAITFISVSWVLTLPVVLAVYFLRLMGGGDVKLFLVASLMWDTSTTLSSLVYAFPLSLAFGLLVVILKGKGRAFFKNIYALIRFQKVQNTQLETFPFSVGLLLGWMTFTVLKSL